MVFVLDANKKPLSPCHEAVARKLLKQGKAAIFRRYPIRRVWVINPKTRVIPNKKKQQQKYCCRKSRNPRFKE